MPSKDFMLDDLAVTVYKRRSSRNLRLSITPTGKVRVSIPAWAPYSAGLKFAQSRQTWIREQQSPVQPLLDGQAIGKAHHLYFAAKSGLAKPAGRVYDTSVVVSYPSSSEPGDPQVQRAARQACIRALRVQAKQLLPQRLQGVVDERRLGVNALDRHPQPGEVAVFEVLQGLGLRAPAGAGELELDLEQLGVGHRGVAG